MTRIYGVDFSGAKDAGNKIWISRGVAVADSLRVEKCSRAGDYLQSSEDRNRCLAKLREFIQEQSDGVFGLDFPFGLPRPVVEESDWVEFIQGFKAKYPTMEAFDKARKCFKAVCVHKCGKKESKRETDKRVGTPWSPYNLRLWHQTYCGIKHLLVPLVQDKAVCVLPMQNEEEGKPRLLEICPTSTLKELNLCHTGYKGNTPNHRKVRQRILQELEEKGKLLIGAEVRKAVIDDRGGDALDSVIAAFEIHRTVKNLPKLEPDDWNKVEGYVYVHKDAPDVTQQQ